VVVGVGFFCLFLMSLKVFRGDETGVVLSLIAMEFVLGAFLLKATFNLASKWCVGISMCCWGWQVQRTGQPRTPLTVLP
jgi:hypothetical protein